jgi:predicted DNA-binding transcriptional regulator YafY
MQPLPLGEIIIDYTNWRGERRERHILPRTLWFGTTEHHPEPQWFILALDVEKNATRDFALRDIHSVR